MSISADLQAFADDALTSARGMVVDQLAALGRMHHQMTQLLDGEHVDLMVRSEDLIRMSTIVDQVAKANALRSAATMARQAGQ